MADQTQTTYAGTIATNDPQPNEPHVWVRLRDWADNQELLNRLDDELCELQARESRFKRALDSIATLCPVTDDARAYIGNMARDALNPPKPVTAKLGQEQSK